MIEIDASNDNFLRRLIGKDPKFRPGIPGIATDDLRTARLDYASAYASVNEPCPSELDGIGHAEELDITAPGDGEIAYGNIDWEGGALSETGYWEASRPVRSKTSGELAADLEAAKAAKKTAATAKFRAIIAAGRVIGGATIDLTSEGFARLEQAKAVLVAGGGPISAVTIRGEPIDLPDVDTVTAVIGAARAYWLAAAARERALYDAVDEAADIAAVAAIDEASGWPS